MKIPRPYRWKINHFSQLLDYINFDWDSCCWNWKKARSGEYGKVGFRGKVRSAHRVSKYLYGDISEDELMDKNMVLRHECDNPCCINPDHLHVGTQLDNIADRESKGRGRKGLAVWSARLTEDDVRSIRKEFKNSKASAESLANKFKMSISNIKSIAYRQKWKHIK